MLTIYRASAGTGKTHVLTGEYLQILFSGIDMHTKILSVTFTNKATDEMKKRIITELHRLSSGLPSDYLTLLIAKYQKPEEVIRQQARNILIHILHDYSRFNISTIDHFFQQTLRAFIREAGINGNYHIEMDKDLVLVECVDNLLADLDRKENKALMKWLLRFSEDKVENGEEWDFRRNIKKLADELFKEKYKTHSTGIEKDIADKQSLTNYQNTLFALIRTTETEARQIGKIGLATLSRYNLQPSDLIKKSNSPFFLFVRLMNGEMTAPTPTFKQLADNSKACYAKTEKPEMKNTIEEAFHNGLNDSIKQVIHFFDHLTDYYTAKEIIRNFYTLGILTDISQHIKIWREEKNRMLISDANELLHKVINGSDIPFIYEKTGTHIDHFMIDEFQDTSRMQWSNFRPLVKESLACLHPNLIVGDIKQSIYRFRNSDWTLLDEQIQKDFSSYEMTEQTLNVNWRSHRLIVEFNNAFFAVVPTLLQDTFNQGLAESALDEKQQVMYASKISSAYHLNFQHVSPPRQSSDGHVHIEFLPDEDDCSWKQESMNRLPKLIESLQEQGYSLQDIAILVRTKSQGVVVADTLLAYKDNHPNSSWKYDIISEDALKIANAYSVNFIINMLAYLNRPHDITLKKLALVTYTAMLAKSQASTNMQQCFCEEKSIFSDETIRELRNISHRSFYETVEGIYRLFKSRFPENEQAYIQAFLDVVTSFAEKESADTDKFLRWWANFGDKEKISTPEAQNAIRILTIHKSKGLGFKVVIIPFCDWEMDHINNYAQSTIVWCHPQNAPFNKLQMVPVTYSHALRKTHFAEDYYHEKLHAYIDNLNALYVSFTRAKESLFVFTPNDETKRRKEVSKLISMALKQNDKPTPDYLTSLATTDKSTCETVSFPAGLHIEGDIFEWGSRWHPTYTPAAVAGEIPMQQMTSILPDNRIFLRLHCNGGFLEDKKRKYGILMHEILSNIQTDADIRRAIMDKEAAGEIDHHESIELTERLERLLVLPEVAKWFDGSMQVMNEIEILYGNGKTYRPDRIMLDGEQAFVIDYKFGDNENPHDRQQVKRYMSLVQESGYQHVTGYLWYIELHKIVPVIDKGNTV